MQLKDYKEWGSLRSPTPWFILCMGESELMLVNVTLMQRFAVQVTHERSFAHAQFNTRVAKLPEQSIEHAQFDILWSS